MHRSIRLVGAVAAVGVVSALFAGTASATRYIVLYKGGTTASDAAVKVEMAGGAVVANWSQIGVVVAESSSPTFADAFSNDARIEGVAASTSPIAMVAPVESESHDGEPPELPNAPAGQDSLAPLQWDMRQIHSPEANAITGGSPLVVVGDIDTGLDKDHPDLVENIDFSRSVSCESGAPDPNPAAWDDRHGHGTHTAGTIAAAHNGFGITGVAPNVRIAGIKSSTDEGFFFVEMVVCSFMWAGSQHIDVTNNSYFMDPFLYNCRNDAAQRTLWKAAQRAVRFAQSQGVTVIAATGNDSDDRAHPSVDVISPDFPPGSEVEREITNACVVVPLEISGVIGVSGVGNQRQVDGDDDPNDYRKSFFSAYGVGVTDVTAPSGDSLFGVTAEAPNGRVLSTWPAEIPCTRFVQDPPPPPEPTAVYCYLQGTSMAAPHAAGVAALIISRFGNLRNPQNGKMRPTQVEQYLQHTADAQPCPTELPPGFEAFTRPGGEPQECDGGPGYNSWYGSGQINALRAVLHDTAHS